MRIPLLLKSQAMDFWYQHGWLFLICVTLFPRCTMLLGTTVSFSFFNWLGWLFAPHLTVAILATNEYWQTNTYLCVMAWMVALYAQNKYLQKWWRRSHRWYHHTTITIRRRYF